MSDNQKIGRGKQIGEFVRDLAIGGLVTPLWAFLGLGLACVLGVWLMKHVSTGDATEVGRFQIVAISGQRALRIDTRTGQTWEWSGFEYSYPTPPVTRQSTLWDDCVAFVERNRDTSKQK